MTVYFIRAGTDGPVKIGLSIRAVDSRMASLQVGSADTLSVIRTIAGGAAVEKWAHDQFKHLSVRGEWFEYSDDMLTAEPPGSLQRNDVLADPAISGGDIFDTVIDVRLTMSRAALDVSDDVAAREALLLRANHEATVLASLASDAAKRARSLLAVGRKAKAKVALNAADQLAKMARLWAKEYDRHGGETALVRMQSEIRDRSREAWRVAQQRGKERE